MFTTFPPFFNIQQDSFCHFNPTKVGAQLSGYVNVTSGSLDALKEALATKGPVAVGIDASHLSFVFYANGVYYEPKCGECCLYFTFYVCTTTTYACGFRRVGRI